MAKTVTSRFVLKGDNQLNTAFSKAQRQLNGLTKQVKQFGFIAKAAIGFAVVSALKKSATAAGEFERAMAEVATLLDDTSGLDALTQSVKDLAIEYGQVPVEEVAALYQIISAGAQDAASQVGFLDAANKLALGGVTDLKTAADGLTSALNAYKGTGLTAARASDIMFGTMKRGKTTIGELSDNLGQVVTIASQVGVSFEEVGAAIATITAAGIRTPQAVSGLRGVFSALLKQSDQTVKAAKDLRIEFDVGRLRAVGYVGVLRDIANSNATESQLSRLVGRVEGLTSILAVARNDAEKFKENLAGIATNAGASDKAVAKLAETTDQKFKKLGAMVAVEMLTAGGAINEAMLPAAEFITNNMGDALDLMGRGFKVAANTGIIAFELLKGSVIGLADYIINGPNRAVDLLIEKFNAIPGVPDIDFKFGNLSPKIAADFERSQFIVQAAMEEIAAIISKPLPSTEAGLLGKLKEIEVTAQRLPDVVRGSLDALQEIEVTAQRLPDVVQGSTDKFREMDQFATQAARNIQTQFADFLFDPFDQGLKGMLKGFANTIRRMIAQAAAAKILQMLFGGLTGSSNSFISAIGGFFGGGKAHGGPVSAGVPYLVGERGPEVVVPRGAGTVIPNNQLGSNVTVNIDARETENPGRLLALVPVIQAQIEQSLMLKSRRGYL